MRHLLFIFLFGWLALGHSTLQVHDFADPAQEQRYKKLIAELRCLVCQNQNLADSNAELAQDLRQQTYEMVTAGSSEGEIVDYMVARYGDFVLYRPPFKFTTALLWVGPFLILTAGVMILLVVIRRRIRQAAPRLSDAERSRARDLLQGDASDHEG